jgi:hypothetical protein
LLDLLAALGNICSLKQQIDDQNSDDDSNTSSNRGNHGLMMEGAKQQQLNDL